MESLPVRAVSCFTQLCLFVSFYLRIGSRFWRIDDLQEIAVTYFHASKNRDLGLLASARVQFPTSVAGMGRIILLPFCVAAVGVEVSQGIMNQGSCHSSGPENTSGLARKRDLVFRLIAGRAGDRYSMAEEGKLRRSRVPRVTDLAPNN